MKMKLTHSAEIELTKAEKTAFITARDCLADIVRQMKVGHCEVMVGYAWEDGLAWECELSELESAVNTLTFLTTKNPEKAY